MVQVSAATAATCGILLHLALLARAFVVVRVGPSTTRKNTSLGPIVRRSHHWENEEETIYRQRGAHSSHRGSSMRFGSNRKSLFLSTPLVGRPGTISSPSTTQLYYRDVDRDDDNDNIRLLYRTVAEQDPEWFQKFVIELLGEDDDILDPEMIALAKRRSEHQQQAAETLVPSDLSPLRVDTATTQGKAQDENVTSEAVGSEETTMTTLMEVPVANALTTENRTLISVLQPSEMKEAAASMSSATSSQTHDVRGGKNASPQINGDGDHNGPLVLTKESTVDSPISTLQKNTTDAEILPVAADTSEPLLNNAPSDASKEDSNVELERAEPPNNSDTAISAPPQTGDETVELSRTLTIQAQSPPLPISATSTAKGTETVTTSAKIPPTSTTASTTDQVDKRVVVYEDGFAREWKCVPLSTLIELGYTGLEITSLQPDALDLIVQDSIRKPRSGIPQRWKMLDGDAVARIVTASEWDKERTTTNSPTSKTQPRNDFEGEHSASTDSDSKPLPTEPTIQAAATAPSRRSTSIPPKPKAATAADTKQSDNKEYSTKRSVAETDPGVPVKNTETSRASRSRVGRVGNVNDGDDPTAKRRRTGDDSPRDERRAPTPSSPRERRRDVPRREDRQKTVYSARPSPQQKAKRKNMDDPPPSSSGLWPDMDTFRRLLRNEADLRLKILGDDWTTAVREEADWRHDLYKNWLWTLHQGIGEPFVESRSDRARRRQRRPPSAAAPPPPEARGSRRVRER